MAWIDWNASARMSAAQSRDEFVVREYFAEEAPRVIVVHDRRPSMALYPPELPWLSKPAAVREASAAIVASALASRGVIGYWDFTDGPVWIPPHGRVQAPRDAEAFSAPEDTLARAFDHLARLRADVPSGSFVFVISDFLAPPPEECWRRAQARRWDVVPVIVQDALWEQSFPELHGVVIPVADPRTGAVAPVRLTAREARARREANEARLARLLEFFRALRIDPVVLATSDPYAIDGEFLAWAARRRLLRGRGR